MQPQSSRGVQQHEVNAAADALLAQQVRPTVERVRMKIGHGSPNTVGPMLETWFATLGPRLGVAQSEEGPGMPAPARQAFEGVWSTVLALAREQGQRELAGERDHLDQQRAELEALRSALATQEAAATEREQLLREARDLALRELEASATRVRDVQASLQQRDGELIEARNSIATLVQQKDLAERDHRKQLEVLSRNHERAQERFAAHERRLLQDVDRAREETKAAKKALAEAEARLTKQRGDLEHANESMRDALQEMQLERAVLQERVVAGERRAQQIQAQLAANSRTPGRRVRKGPAKA